VLGCACSDGFYAWVVSGIHIFETGIRPAGEVECSLHAQGEATESEEAVRLVIHGFTSTSSSTPLHLQPAPLGERELTVS
jgi:hypothetical protein